MAELVESNESLQKLVTEYENAMSSLLDKLRPFSYTHAQSIINLHKHYQALLETERSTSMQLRLEQAEWQAALGRAAQYARLALRGQSEADLPYVRDLKELREENRLLRRLAGWEERETSSDEEDSRIIH